VRRLRAAIGAAILTVCAWSPWAGADVPSTYYVSLGDSLAQGWQPGPDGRMRRTAQGYVDYVASRLRTNHPGLIGIKLGCGGETTASMISGGTCHYTNGSALREAEAFLRSHRGQVVAVSVGIGDNDVERCLAGGSVNGACVKTEMGNIRARLPQIARRLRAAAGKHVPIAGLTDYDQFLAYWLRGARGRSFARSSVPVVLDLNRTADAIYRAAGVRPGDATHRFATTDLATTVPLAGHGRVPKAVARVCAWTWACSRPPIGFNDHANATGYRVLGQVVWQALRTP
jgi:lysophospholipase L1-like esterase